MIDHFLWNSGKSNTSVALENERIRITLNTSASFGEQRPIPKFLKTLVTWKRSKYQDPHHFQKLGCGDNRKSISMDPKFAQLWKLPPAFDRRLQVKATSQPGIPYTTTFARLDPRASKSFTSRVGHITEMQKWKMIPPDARIGKWAST